MVIVYLKSLLERGFVKIFIGLGSNLGKPWLNLETAIGLLAKEIQNIKVSPTYRTQAVLPENAPDSWDLIYFNAALSGTTDLGPEELMGFLKKTESTMGRLPDLKWAPRIIDLDLLSYGDQLIESNTLSVPHPEILHRSFVLDPLKDLDPTLQFEGRSVLEASRKLPLRQTQLMAIVNLTPDSFSGDGLVSSHESIELLLDHLDQLHVPIVDFGAESTRPDADPLAPDTEWKRLEPALSIFQQKWSHRFIRPKISVDTRHYQTAEKCIEWGVDMINDVGGLSCTKMQKLASIAHRDFTVMHNLGLPANKQKVLPRDGDPVAALSQWWQSGLEKWTDLGIDPARLIFDPGIGFGKSAAQSRKILQNITHFTSQSSRVLVGHSRKSFLSPITEKSFAHRDLETIGCSTWLCDKGVDILRVHNVEDHMRVLQARQFLKG